MESEAGKLLFGLKIGDLISFGALGIAFLALFVAPFINSRNSKRQVIAPMRQAWINALRDKISEFISIVSIERLHISPSVDDSAENKKEAHREDRNRYERLQLLKTSIELHINSTEMDHLELVDLLGKISSGYHNNGDTKEDVDSLIRLSRRILKREWGATKKT